MNASDFTARILESELEETSEKLQEAAELGQELFDENQALKAEIESMQRDFNSQKREFEDLRANDARKANALNSDNHKLQSQLAKLNQQAC
jgi:predicted  nucleic acid-binding Zn-ribbon protein